MVKLKFVPSLKIALCGALAMMCVSCAHQSKETSLMIDSDAPSEEHVWSETRDVQSTVASEDNSEEAQLEAIAQQNDADTVTATIEETPAPSVKTDSVQESKASELSSVTVASNDASEETIPEFADQNPTLGSIASANAEGNEMAKFDEGTVKRNEPLPESVPANESETTSSREVSSDSETEAMSPSANRTEPTVAVPPKIKTDERIPTKKETADRKSSKNNQGSKAKLVVQMNKQTLTNEPEVVVTPVPQVNEGVQPKVELKANALGEEEENDPQLASVEIATFVQNHWLALMSAAVVGVLALYFLVMRRKNEDTQAL